MIFLILICLARALLLQEAIGLFSEIENKANLTEVISSLREGSGKDLQTLGEFYMFGMNLNDYIFSDADDFVGTDGQFKRDFDKAFGYFHAAKMKGNEEAYFYIAFAVQQAYLIADFDGKVGKILDHNYNFYMNYQAGLDVNSRLVQATVSPYVMQCLSDPIAQPSFLKPEEVKFYRGPFKPEDDCGGPCKDSITFIIQEAADTVNFIQSTGTEISKIEHLGEVDQLEPFGDSASKAKLLQENLALEEHTEYVDLAQQYIAGNPQAGIEPNPVEALNYYNLAAAQGNLQAIETLGLMYGQGIGTEQNSTRALELVKQASDAGSLVAKSELAFMTYYGVGVDQNKSKALELYMEAASKGHIESMSNVGVFFLNGEGTEKDYDKAFAYFTLAAAGNHPNGIYNLGLMYFNGKGTEPNCEEARELFYEVTLKGEAHTIASKAYKLYREQDYLGAYLYYALASFMGVESAQISAGYMWEKGLVPLTCRNGNDNCAASYYMLALEQHDSDWAADRLGDMEFLRHNYTKAYEYYDLSFSAYSLYSLGYLSQEGLGKDRNLTEAEQYYKSVMFLSATEVYSWEDGLPASLAWLYVKMLQWPVVSWVANYLA